MNQIDQSSLDHLLLDAQALHERINAMVRDVNERFMKRGSILEHIQNGTSNSTESDSFESLSPENSAPAVAKEIADELLKPTLRYKRTAQPGIPPFRHDPVKRYEIYKEEWARFPIPGEDKRLALRWKVRDFMTRQDIPDMPKSD